MRRSAVTTPYTYGQLRRHNDGTYFQGQGKPSASDCRTYYLGATPCNVNWAVLSCPAGSMYFTVADWACCTKSNSALPCSPFFAEGVRGPGNPSPLAVFGMAPPNILLEIGPLAVSRLPVKLRRMVTHEKRVDVLSTLQSIYEGQSKPSKTASNGFDLNMRWCCMVSANG